ncbi:MAG: helix-turn-helix domain-containing protein [Oscillospiraceae bacterium]|nr:helix-turn-helix domain-containing protein [Oscillospiraceae bacterium]
MSRISDNIKNLRIKKGMTQKQLGKALGVSENYINEVEIGKKVINDKIIEKISKVLGEDLNDINMYFEDSKDEVKDEKPKVIVKKAKPIEEPVNEAFTSAFSQVIKDIPYVNYDLKQTGEKILLPIISNKIDGYPHDKVCYLKIKDNSLSFLRILKNDIAFCFISKEFTGNGVYLIEENDENRLIQIRELDKEKYLMLFSDQDSLSSLFKIETIHKNNITILAKVVKIEFKMA